MTIYKCHNWAFNPKNQELIYSNGQVKQLPGRISLCLNTLLESRGETVQYEQLLMRVWGTTHKDPSTISSVISELRKVIGCGRDKVKLLHTVPKRGYRFIGEVEVQQIERNQDLAQSFSSSANTPAVSIADQIFASVADTTKQETITEQPPGSESTEANSLVATVTAGRRLSNSMLMILLGALFAISASILSANLLLGSEKNRANYHSVFESFETLTHEAGSEVEFDISSDGQWLIYSRISETGLYRVVAKNLFSGELFQMPFVDDSNYRSPSFSPDLSKVVYVKNSPKACEIWLIGFTQGHFDESSNRRVSRCGLPGFWTTTDFSSDGNMVYFSRSESLHDPFRIYRHDLRSGYERNLTAPTSSGRGDYAFSVSKDGKQLAIVRNKMWQSSRILVKNLEDDSIRMVDEVPFLLNGVEWYSPDKLVYRGADWQYYLFDLNNGEKDVIVNLKQPLSFPVSANGRLFGYRGFRQNASIWSLSHSGNIEQKALTKVIFSPYIDYSPVMASTSKLFFLSNRSGVTQLWHKEGERYRKYSDLAFPKRVKSLHYSEAQQALFGVSKERIFRFDTQSEQLQWLTAKDDKIRNLSLSDDGRLIYAVDAGEKWQLRTRSVATDEETLLGISGFSAHLYQEQLYFTRYREKGLWKMALGAEEPQLLIEDFETLVSSYWDISDGVIYQYRSDTGAINQYDVADGRMLAQPLELEGKIKNIQCYEALEGCLLDYYQDGETEIIELQ